MPTESLPSEFNVFKASFNHTTYVFNQGNTGSCTYNAIAKLYLYELQRQKGSMGDYVPSCPSLERVLGAGGHRSLPSDGVVTRRDFREARGRS